MRGEKADGQLAQGVVAVELPLRRGEVLDEQEGVVAALPRALGDVAPAAEAAQQVLTGAVLRGDPDRAEEVVGLRAGQGAVGQALAEGGVGAVAVLRGQAQAGASLGGGGLHAR